MENSEELSRIELTAKIFFIKDRFFDFIVNYQYLENFFYSYLQKNSSEESLSKNESFTSLVNKFINVAKEKNERCDDEVEEQLKELLFSFERNEFVHEFTNKYAKYLLGTIDNCPREIIQEAYEEIGKSKIKLNKIAALLTMKGFKYKHNSTSKTNRPFALSENTLLLTKNNPTISNSFAANDIKKALIENYFYLFATYNTINRNLLNIIKEMNIKTNMWTENEIKNLNNRAIGFLNAFLKNQDGKNGIIVNDILSNIKDFSQQIRRIYIDRNYWIHYFAIAFVDLKGDNILEAKSSKYIKKLLFVLDATKQSILFANNFNNQLVRLKIHKEP